MNQHANLAGIPKLLCEQTPLTFNGEFFTLGMGVGTHVNHFALTPEHAKRLAERLVQAVQEFEAAYRQISTDQKIPSPLELGGVEGAPVRYA